MATDVSKKPPPTRLKDEAVKKLWRDLLSELDVTYGVSTLDYILLENLCYCQGKLWEIEKRLENGDMIEFRRGVSVKSAAFSIMQELLKQIKGYSEGLGIGIAARKRIERLGKTGRRGEWDDTGDSGPDLLRFANRG